MLTKAVVLLVCAVALCAATEFHSTISTKSARARGTSFEDNPNCNALYGLWYFNAHTTSTHGLTDYEFNGSPMTGVLGLSGASIGTIFFDKDCDIYMSGFNMPYYGPFADDFDTSERSCELTFDTYSGGTRFKYEGDVHLYCQTFKYNKEIRCVSSVIPSEWIGGFGEVVEYQLVRGSF